MDFRASLLRCFSWLVPVPPKNHKARDIPVFQRRAAPLFCWLFFINLQVLSAQGTIQESISATSSLPGALFLAALPDFFFFKYCIRKMAPSSSPPLSWTVSSSPFSSHGGLGASAAPGQYSFFRTTLLQTLEPSPSRSYTFVRVPGCLGLDFFFPPQFNLEC